MNLKRVSTAFDFILEPFCFDFFLLKFDVTYSKISTKLLLGCADYDAFASITNTFRFRH